jgi:hypothetical protein
MLDTPPMMPLEQALVGNVIEIFKAAGLKTV